MAEEDYLLPRFAHDCNGDRDGRYCGLATCFTCGDRCIYPLGDFKPMGKKHKRNCDVLDEGADAYECDCKEEAVMDVPLHLMDCEDKVCTGCTPGQTLGERAARAPLAPRYRRREDVELIRRMIVERCDSLKATLLQKNSGYGNSVFDPVNVCSPLPAGEQIKVRIDDKLSRLKRGDPKADNGDTKRDAAGYFILWDILDELEAEDD